LSTVREMFTDPFHPYAQALINSLPSLDNKGVFQGIPGLAPSLLQLPGGCAFHPRCAHVMDVCKTVIPNFQTLPDGRRVACHLYPKKASP
jgi:peptide/nickel transport system ATP-binding protein